MKITVTKKDIEKGRKDHCCLCPVALAISRATNLNAWVTRLQFGAVGRKAWELPQKARAFIAAFDAGKPVKPFSFNIDL